MDGVFFFFFFNSFSLAIDYSIVVWQKYIYIWEFYIEHIQLFLLVVNFGAIELFQKFKWLHWHKFFFFFFEKTTLT